MCNKYLPTWLGGAPDLQPIMQAPQKAPAPPDPGIAAQAAYEDDLRKRALRKGAASTIITGGLGDPNFGGAAAPASLKTYLGN